MAPELLRGELSTCASDVYAFGITLYEVFSRKIPYGVESPAEINDILKQVCKPAQLCSILKFRMYIIQYICKNS